MKARKAIREVTGDTPPKEIRLMTLSYMHCNVLRRLITSTKGQGGQLVHHQPVVCFSKRVEWG